MQFGKRKTYRFLSTLAGFVLAVSSCSGNATDPAACKGGVTMSVDPTTTPLFSWIPSCGVARLVVEDADVPPGQAIRWQISGAAIQPPVRYGVVPAGASDGGSPAQGLVVGQLYRSTVYRAGVATPSGSITFRATP